MEYYGNTLCISARELVDGGIMTASNYKQLSARKRINVVRSGKGQGRYALVAVDSIPTIYRKMVDELYPGGDTVRLEGWITSNYETDQAAVAFFNDRAKTGPHTRESEGICGECLCSEHLHQALQPCKRIKEADGRKIRLGKDGNHHQNTQREIWPYATSFNHAIQKESSRIQEVWLCLSDKWQVRKPKRTQG